MTNITSVKDLDAIKAAYQEADGPSTNIKSCCAPAQAAFPAPAPKFVML